MEWFVYILECRDGTFYTGITNDLDKRLQAHRDGAASKYTRSRLPVRVVYTESCATRSDALKRESMIKEMRRADKRRLISRARAV